MDREYQTGSVKLFKVDVVEWVLSTARGIAFEATEDRSRWNEIWEQEYLRLGGVSTETARKPCPRAAAYALWYLGYLKDSPRKKLVLPVGEIRRTLGKNALYAVIAVSLFRSNPEASVGEIWQAVRARFESEIGEKPSRSEQGEIRLASALLRSNQIT